MYVPPDEDEFWEVVCVCVCVRVKEDLRLLPSFLSTSSYSRYFKALKRDDDE